MLPEIEASGVMSVNELRISIPVIEQKPIRSPQQETDGVGMGEPIERHTEVTHGCWR